MTHDGGVTRIISGQAGGRRLRTPAGGGTRPTSDRVREALFSALESRDAVQGAHVMDLYAGSGALGLEAASRGAASVLLVESDRGAIGVIRANIADVGAAGARVQAGTVEAALDRTPTLAYDLVLADPPYDVDEDSLAAVLDLLLTREWAVIALLGAYGSLQLIMKAHAASMAVAAAGGMTQWLKKTKLVTAATKAWTAVTWAFNIAMRANPLILIGTVVLSFLAAFGISALLFRLASMSSVRTESRPTLVLRDGKAGSSLLPAGR